MARFDLNYNNNVLKQRRSELRNNSTKAEQILWEYIRKKKIHGFRFRRQFSIGNYIVDFFCPKLKLAIELDGEIHDQIDQKEYDKFRQENLENGEVKFLRFNNTEIYHNIKTVLLIINNKVLELSESTR